VSNLKYIELFAGVGGISLGLESAGFELVFANEISPMAANTFAHNILREDIETTNYKDENNESKVIWLKSQYPKYEILKRLKENLFNINDAKYHDYKNTGDILGKLVIGHIDDLISLIESDKGLISYLKNMDLDLISGGPPCQSFSLAGKRKRDSERNLLPWSFAKMASIIKPKVVLLENVKGITIPFKEVNKKYYAWFEIAKSFALFGYVPVCMLINAQHFGIPQNRVRFILLAFRKDIFDGINIPDNELSTGVLYEDAKKFFSEVNSKGYDIYDSTPKNIIIYNIENKEHLELFNGLLLPKPVESKRNVKAAIGNIKNTDIEHSLDKLNNSEYIQYLNKIFPAVYKTDNKLQNHLIRNHRFEVKARFRLYQVLGNGLDPNIRKEGFSLLQGRIKPDLLSKKSVNFLMKSKLLFSDNSRDIIRLPKDEKELLKHLGLLSTRKHSQRALVPDMPAPSQLTIPDDCCHYDPHSLRTLTVREMARIQSFPDWFVFKSKTTTGGTSRSFEVPQYTQVGNAVPPVLSLEIGKLIKKLLSFEH